MIKFVYFQLMRIVQQVLRFYISEVDLEYPDELYELQNDNPLAPEKLEISHNIL